VTFSSKEISLLQDSEFLITKNTLLQKLDKMLAVTQEEIQAYINKSDFDFPEKTFTRGGKISRGENYRHLPYLILDYPRKFGRDSIFAFRVMFWWGNFFSATLHIEGKALETYRSKLLKNCPTLFGDGFFICVNNDPYEYHFEEDNYKRLERLDPQKLNTILKEGTFLKLSRKLAIREWEKLPAFSRETLELLLRALS